MQAEALHVDEEASAFSQCLLIPVHTLSEGQQMAQLLSMLPNLQAGAMSLSQNVEPMMSFAERQENSLVQHDSDSRPTRTVNLTKRESKALQSRTTIVKDSCTKNLRSP